MSALRMWSDRSVLLGADEGVVAGSPSHLGSFCFIFACFFEVSKNFLLES